MKLELKHLAPYLPCGLEGVASFLEDTIFIVDTLNARRLRVIGNTKFGNNVPLGCFINEFKPILRPLSEFGDSDDVRKVHEFLGLGNWCEMYDEYFRVWFNDVANTDKLVLQAPQEIFNYFLANHYDVFSLIPKKLAIDINTIK